MNKNNFVKKGLVFGIILTVLINGGMIADMIADGALLPYFGKITATITVEQPVSVDGEEYPASVKITESVSAGSGVTADVIQSVWVDGLQYPESEITEDVSGVVGGTVCSGIHWLENMAGVPIDIKFETECSAAAAASVNFDNCDGITTTIYDLTLETETTEITLESGETRFFRICYSFDMAICPGTYTIATKILDVREQPSIERKALLIGCWDYPGTENDLKGPQNDVNNMKKLLIKGFNFNENNIRILSNPEKQDVIDEIEYLKQNTVDQDIKFLYYAGHGQGGSFESIQPIDLAISDKELKNLLSDEENLTVIFDSCNSGGLCHETDDTEDGQPIRGIDSDSKIIGMAANSTQLAWEGLFGGYFTRYIYKAFTHNRNSVRTLISGDDTRVSLEEALLFAKDKVENLIWWWKRANPQIYDSWPTKGNNAEQFYLSNNPINKYWSFLSLCPVNIHAYDRNGNHVGLNEYGNVQDEISYVLYSGPWNDEELLIVFNNGTNDYIHIFAEAYDDGYFTLECQDYDKETILYNIFIVNGSVASVIVEDGVFGVMEIDDDGDGIIDRTIAPIGILLPVTIDIDPDTLNLNSSGKWVTCYIELPEGYDVANINISTILLNDVVPSEDHPTNISDYDNDGIPDLMVKFDRQVVQGILEVGDTVEIAVTGELFDGTLFEGIDYIRVIYKPSPPDYPPICDWIESKGGPTGLTVPDIFELVDAYLFDIPLPDPYNFIPTSLEIYGVIDYFNGDNSNGDANTGCSYC